MDFLDNFSPNKEMDLETLKGVWEQLKLKLEYKELESASLRYSLSRIQNFPSVIESSKMYKTASASPGALKRYLRVLFEQFYKIKIFAKKSSFESKEQELILITMLCYYLQETIRAKSTFRIIIRTFADTLVKYSLNLPPTYYKIFDLKQIKLTMDFFVEKIFWFHTLITKAFGSKKMMLLRTFKIFRRKNPMDLRIEDGEEIAQPLDIPFLRQYLLEEGEFYYTDEEIKKMVEGGNLGSLTADEKEYVERRYKELKREELIKLVMDKRIGELKEEVGVKLKELDAANFN